MTGIVGTCIYTTLTLCSIFCLCGGKFFLGNSSQIFVRRGVGEMLERSMFVVIYVTLGCLSKLIFFSKLSISGTPDLASVCGYILSGVFLLLSALLISRQWTSVSCFISTQHHLVHHTYFFVIILLTSSIIACLFASTDGFPANEEEISNVCSDLVFFNNYF